jgi:hypothetical protein
MNSGEQLSDDDIGLRSASRRGASALLKLAVLVGIMAGGVWAYVRLEKRRAVREPTAEQNSAVARLFAAGGDVLSHEGRIITANFTRRPADDEGFAALAEGGRVVEPEVGFGPPARPVVQGDERRPLIQPAGLQVTADRRHVGRSQSAGTAGTRP